MKTKVITLISTLFLSCLAAFAEVNTGVNLNKTATYDYATQTGIITLENYVGQVTKKINTGKSADVVLIVDGSRSMNPSGVYGMDALYSAVGSFVTQLRTASLENSTITHRVSLIIFAGNCNLLCDLTSVEIHEVSWFQNLIKTACGYVDGTHINNYGSGTMAHMALGLASYVMTGEKTIANTVSSGTTHTDWSQTWITPSEPAGAREGCNRYVVLMTDGALSGQPLKQDKSNYGGNIAYPDGNRKEGNKDAEDQAVAVTKALKNHSTRATTVYSIGFFDDGEVTNGVHSYLNNVSSNWLSPTDSDNTGDTDYPHDYLCHDYFIRVNRTGGDLSDIFAKVSEEVVAGCAAVDLSSAEVKDIINGENFKLPDGVVDAATLESAVTVYTVPCTKYDQYDQDGDGKEYTFDESTHNTVTGLTFRLDKDADDNPIITVRGFDYTANWCGYEYDTSYPKNSKPHGCKLVIKIPFKVNNYNAGLGAVETNLDGSGFTGVISGSSDKLTKLYGTPIVDLYELTISRTGLKAGESVIYKVTDKNGNLIYTVALTGTGSGAISQKLLYVPAGNVTVTEQTGWGWANTPTPDDITIEIGTPTTEKPLLKPNPTYSFSGTPTGDKNPEDHNDNRFN